MPPSRTFEGARGKCEKYLEGTYHSTVTYLTAAPRVLAISFWSLLPARPPPQVVPRMTCVTVRRPRAMDWLAPWALSTYFSL